jgi:hypothetical protein
MSRPTLEVADILRASGGSFLDRHGSHLASQHRKVMDAIVAAAPPQQPPPTAQIKCPICSKPMLVVERFTSHQLPTVAAIPPPKPCFDSS